MTCDTLGLGATGNGTTITKSGNQVGRWGGGAHPSLIFHFVCCTGFISMLIDGSSICQLSHCGLEQGNEEVFVNFLSIYNIPSL